MLYTFCASFSCNSMSCSGYSALHGVNPNKKKTPFLMYFKCSIFSLISFILSLRNKQLCTILILYYTVLFKGFSQIFDWKNSGGNFLAVMWHFYWNFGPFLSILVFQKPTNSWNVHKKVLNKLCKSDSL